MTPILGQRSPVRYEARHMAVTVLSTDRSDAVVTVLCDAFFDYPVMRYVLGDAPDYPTRLRTLVGLFVAARCQPRGLLLGAHDADGTMVAAAAIDLPGDRAMSPAFEQRRKDTWAELGRDAEARYVAYGQASREFDHGAHHHHLGMIGVRASHQGSGLSRALLEHLHALADADPDSSGISLTTELPRNIGLYEYFGYEITGHARVSPELETWAFFRPCTANPERPS
jgi:GNAT superfamily N-acetyltransferase